MTRLTDAAVETLFVLAALATLASWAAEAAIDSVLGDNNNAE